MIIEPTIKESELKQEILDAKKDFYLSNDLFDKGYYEALQDLYDKYFT